MSCNYVCYHLHTEDSLLDSCTNYKDYIDYANSLEQKAICFTEHANIYNWYKKKQYAESKGLKYLHGIECYLTERLKNPDDPADKNIRDNYHTILIAKNYDGFIELNNLFFLSTKQDHIYYKRRLTFEEFFNISDNIIKISACVQSPLNKFRKVLENREQNIEDEMIMQRLLQHYDYYEIQYHQNTEQIEFNKYLYEASKTFNKPLIAATDTHSLNKYKAECRTILQYGKTDGAWGDEENECDLTYKSYDELVEEFKKQNSLSMDVIIEAINNTNIMANSVEEIKIDTANKYPILYGEKDEEVLWDTIHKNYQDKLDKGIISENPKYLENINEEMRVFKKIDMIGFMLFMSEIMSWARNQHIATGFARGSVAGSTVAYIINITDVDPVKWNTIFSRFANESRIEAGDIDTDWYEDDRQKVYDYIIDRFGKDKTAYILAMGTLADKSVIDVIGKAFRIKAEKTGTATIYTLDKIKEIKKEYEENKDSTIKKYPDLFYYYGGLANCVVSQSQHPAGIIVSSVNLIDSCGGFYGSDEQVILPIDMDECHDIGQIKYDILGLKSVGVIDKTYKMIGKSFPRADEVDWNDQEVYKDIAEDHTAIFQFESDYSGDCLKRLRPTSVEELSLVNACIRPSGETYRDDLLSRKIHKNPSKIIDDMLAKNLGFLVYQEDTISFLQNICGFSGSDADTVRRAIGKKKEEEVNAALPKILDGYCSKSDQPREIAEKEAKEFLDVIASSAAYQFGYNHSLSYSLLSYLMGYLKHYYPTEFCTAFLNCAKNDDDIVNGTKIATNRGCKIVLPKFRHSRGDYSCDSNTKEIFKGLSSIKYMTSQLADDLYELKDNHYNSFTELLYDILDKRRCDSRQLDVLIKIDFFSEFGDINKLLHVAERFSKLYNKKSIKKDVAANLDIAPKILAKFSDSNTETHFDEIDLDKFMESRNLTQDDLLDCVKYKYETLPDGTKNKVENDISFPKLFKKYNLTEQDKEPFATKIVYGKYDGIHNKELLEYLEKNEQVPKCKLSDRIKYQNDHLGYIEYTDQKLDKRYIVVTQLNTQYSPKFSAYCINNGQIADLKVHASRNPKDTSVKTSYREKPFKDGDILYMKTCQKKPRARKNAAGQWEEVYGEYTWWLNDYDVKNF